MDVLVAAAVAAAALVLAVAIIGVARWRETGRLVHMLRDEGYQEPPQRGHGPSSGVQSK